MNSLVPITESGVLTPALTVRCDIVVSVLEDVDQQEVFQFFCDFPELLLSCAEMYYPLTNQQLIEYAEMWNWYSICWNKRIKWNDDLLDYIHDNTNSSRLLRWCYEDVPVWECISTCPYIDWSFELIEKYKFSLKWNGKPDSFFRSNKIHWTVELLEQFAAFGSWKCLSESAFTNFTWSSELLITHSDKFDWSLLSENKNIPWSLTLICEHSDNWDWTNLSKNPNLPWSDMLIFLFGHDLWDWLELSGNKNIPWSIDLIKACESSIHWDTLSLRGNLGWANIVFFNEFQDKLDFKLISLNRTVKWSTELIEKFETRWDWSWLSGNGSLPWSQSLIEKYADKWRWTQGDTWHTYKGIDALSESISANRGIPWDIKLIERYCDLLDWSYFSITIRRQLTPEMLSRFKDFWHWKGMSHTYDFWTRKLIRKYWEKLKIDEDSVSALRDSAAGFNISILSEAQFNVLLASQVVRAMVKFNPPQ